MDKKYLSKMTVNGQQYNFKDTDARQSIADLQNSVTGGMHYVGETSTALTDGATNTTLIAKSENSLSKLTGFIAGDIVIYGELEFVWNGAKWKEFGSTGSLKSLAFKDNATGNVACAGSNSSSAVTFTGGSTQTVLKAVDDAAVAPSFTEGVFNAGTLPSFTEGAFDAGSLPSLGTATTGSFATEGVTVSINDASETLTFGTASTSNAVTALGTFNAGSLPSKAADTFSAGSLPSKAADTFNAGSAATFTTQEVITDLGTATAAAQVFSGSTVSVIVA